MRWNYYKLRQISLLQSAMDSYYKLRQVLQSAMIITNCDSTPDVRSFGRKKRFKIVIMFSGRRRRSREERNGFVKVDVVK